MLFLLFAVYAYFPEELKNAWKEFLSFLWVKKEPEINKDADEIAAEFGRKILREVRELGGDENDIVLHNDFARRREIAREVMRTRQSHNTSNNHGISRQGDFVQIDTGVKVFPECNTITIKPPKADRMD